MRRTVPLVGDTCIYSLEDEFDVIPSRLWPRCLPNEQTSRAMPQWGRCGAAEDDMTDDGATL